MYSRSTRNFTAVNSLVLLLGLTACNAHAVHISPSGTGQVLLFPYYTVRNGFSTLVSVTNTQDNTKAVKVRFREGMNGRAVSDFNVFLAPNDTWTGAVVETANGARTITNDNSCATPADLFNETRKVSGSTQFLNEFFNFWYADYSQGTPPLSTLDRSREGYFEIIEMGVIDPALSPTAAQIVGFVTPDVFTAPTSNCAAMDRFDSQSTIPTASRFPNTGAALLLPPRGGLKGRASLINAATGANYSFGPTVLDGWSSQVAYSASGDVRGTFLSDAFPPTSMVTTPTGTVIARWATGREAVTAALMRESLINEFVLDAGTASQTEWVVTMPTKPFHTDTVYGTMSGNERAPFGPNTSNFGSTGCDRYVSASSNREGYRDPESVFGPVPPPAPGATSGPILCRTANIVPFAYSFFVHFSLDAATALLGSPTPSALGEQLSYTVGKATSRTSAAITPALSGTQGPNGRLTMIFNQPEHKITPLSAVLISPSGTQTSIPGIHFGLPMIGLMLHNYRNTNVQSRYGGVIEHAYAVRVE